MDFQVVVLANGNSKNLTPFVSMNVSKPLLLVANHLFLYYVLRQMEQSNLRDLVVVVEGKDVSFLVVATKKLSCKNNYGQEIAAELFGMLMIKNMGKVLTEYMKVACLYGITPSRLGKVLEDVQVSVVEYTTFKDILVFAPFQFPHLLICFGVTWIFIAGILFPIFFFLLISIKQHTLLKFSLLELLQNSTVEYESAISHFGSTKEPD
ncbi:hypothetical protein V6N12_051372 [Hibiscus sabdariffa]|uniref:Translation initiation factor eIF2B subunit gamma n=1 Tax=Hibiscus sabdariffa TaxID=183260 RepID=A0ABR2GF68_9ROSI